MKMITAALILACSNIAAEDELGSINGFEVHWEDDNTVEVHEGTYIYKGGVGSAGFDSALTIELPEDLDTGEEEANTWYAIYLYQDNDTGDIGGVFSTSPAQAAGYENCWRVGWAYNDSDKKLRKFMQAQSGKNRMICWHKSREIVTALSLGSDTDYTSVSFAEFVPPTANVVCMELDFHATSSGSAGDKGYLRMGSDGTPSHFTVGVVSDYPASFQHMCRLGMNHSLNYKVDNANNRMSMIVLGYIDEL